MEKYCLDSDVLIQAKTGPYGFDIFPAFWSWLEARGAEGSIYSSRYVYQEIKSAGDELSEWAKKQQARVKFFREPSLAVQKRYAEIVRFVSESYDPQHTFDFLADADPWIIAHGAVESCHVVTMEKRAPENSKKPKIPNICGRFRVEFMDLYKMLRATGARF